MNIEEELRVRLLRISPLPWFYNSYNALYSGPLTQATNVLENEHEDAGSPWSETGDYEGEWKGKFDAIDPFICSVPPAYGDTAVGRHAQDALYIELAANAVPKLLETIRKLRQEREMIANTIFVSSSEEHERTLRVISHILERDI